VTIECAADGLGNRSSFGRRPAMLRSKVTNGKSLFASGDGRGVWARRLRDIIELHVSDQGGADMISEARRSLIRRASAITVELERLEAKFATGEAAEHDFMTYTTGANTLRRILADIGLDRVARDITPDLPSYLRTIEGQQS